MSIIKRFLRTNFENYIEMQMVQQKITLTSFLAATGRCIEVGGPGEGPFIEFQLGAGPPHWLFQLPHCSLGGRKFPEN
jgi:hypothetical protein